MGAYNSRASKRKAPHFCGANPEKWKRASPEPLKTKLTLRSIPQFEPVPPDGPLSVLSGFDSKTLGIPVCPVYRGFSEIGLRSGLNARIAVSHTNPELPRGVMEKN